MADDQMTDDALISRAQAVLENCRDCGCAECVKIRNEVISDLICLSIERSMDRLAEREEKASRNP